MSESTNDDREQMPEVGGIAAVAVRGAFLHGVFGHPALHAAFLDRLRAARGLSLRSSAAPPVDDDIDRLADHVEALLGAKLLDGVVGLSLHQSPRTG